MGGIRPKWYRVHLQGNVSKVARGTLSTCIISSLANIEQELSGVFSMRIYEDDYTVRNILEDCSINQRDSFQLHTAGRMIHGIDLDKLNNRLNSIPVAD